MKKITITAALLCCFGVAEAQDRPQNRPQDRLVQDEQGRIAIDVTPPEGQAVLSKYPASFQSNHPVIQSSGLLYGGAPWTGLNYQLGSNLSATGDINGDGKDDMIQRLVNIPDISTPDLEDIIPVMHLVFLGDLSAPSQTITDVFNIFPIGDIDGDGFGDAIVQPEANVATYQFYFGSATGYVSSTHEFVLPSTTFSAVIASGDFDGDGIADVLIQVSGNTLYSISGNTNRAGLQLATISNAPTNVSEIQSFRRSDSSRDYIAFRQGAVIKIARIDQGALVTVQDISFAATPSWFAFTDLNADGVPDLVAAISAATINWTQGLSSSEATSSSTVFGTTSVITKDAAINALTVRPYSDITGDGSGDFIISWNGTIHIANGATVLVNGLNPDGLTQILDSGTGFNSYSQGLNRTDPSKPLYSMGDLTGSGKEELVAVNSFINPNEFRAVAIRDIANSTTWTGVDLNAPVMETREEYHFGANAGDWDNDGIDDYGYIYNDFTSAGSRYVIELSNGGTLQFEFAPNMNFFGAPAFGDINGDGSSDMLIRVRRSTDGVFTEHIDIYSAASANKTQNIASISVEDHFPEIENPFVIGFHNIGDVTGDGKDNFVTMTSGNLYNAGSSYLFSHTGSGYQFNEITQAANNSAVNIGDIDGDGIDDFAVNDFFSSSVKLFLGQNGLTSGHVFTSYRTITYENASYYDSPGATSVFGFRLASGDFTGNGYKDLIIGTFRSGTTNAYAEGDYIFWLFRGHEDGLNEYSYQGVKIPANDLDPLRTFAPLNSEFMSITGLIQTLPDLNGDGSNELLVASNIGSNALILMGGVELMFDETNVGTDFADQQILLQAPNRRTGLGHAANFSNSRANLAVGDFDGDGITEIIMPQPLDFNFQSTPVYEYVLDIEQVEIPTLLEIVSVEDVEDDQGGWVRVHVGGFMFDLFDEYFDEYYETHPPWSVWRKTAANQWVHVTTVPYLEDAARYAEIPVPRTLPHGDTPDDGNSFVFKIVMLGAESEEVRGWALDNIAPAKINGLSATEQLNEVQLKWNPSTAHDLKEYVVYRLTAEGQMDLENPMAVTTETEAVVAKNDVNGFVVVAVDIHNNVSEASTPVLASIDDESGVPLEFALSQNYPNPFNPSTVIDYQLPVFGDVRLAVYDVLGREVAVLVNGAMPAGSYSATFDATNLASGVYMYRLQAAGQIFTRRMTLMK